MFGRSPISITDYGLWHYKASQYPSLKALREPKSDLTNLDGWKFKKMD